MVFLKPLSLVGALTNKINAFSYRPWEFMNVSFRNTESTFSFGSLPTKVVRILKSASLNKNNFWITDIERFSFDSFNRQRITKVYIKKNPSYILTTHFKKRKAILGCGLNKSLYSLLNSRVDTIDFLNKTTMNNLLTSYIPLRDQFSGSSSISKDHNYVVLVTSSLLMTNPQIMAILSLFKTEDSFRVFSFGLINNGAILNLGSLTKIPDFFQHKVLSLFDALDDLSKSTLIIITDPFSVPIKNVYDLAVVLNINIKVLLVSSEINSIYTYNTLVLNK
jgi:hypothetical protein